MDSTLNALFVIATLTTAGWKLRGYWEQHKWARRATSNISGKTITLTGRGTDGTTREWQSSEIWKDGSDI
ncbi:hypothetical protein HMPREF0578_1882 [Mobiluncus mulieris 28-1]|uniref:Uncharacterized protein n=1 Tax=Mobiluncus mulieris TaxID=2052 RepID=A0A7Y0UVC6_9ACTO|nr:hypothetical protein [Mobiluncus mulieris]EEZ90881.1 hypothetical protein HMPREF0578_1882 [Mobiluncus mulieris 28-1]MBB5845757.1 hypothetical protein [Mobiluncus mulieris]MCU9971131.1 hypothetical protein [Mobiluncus mulieris]MCU9975610.1 hypothetical protein [Mobiluncus mulieris]MCU9994938.1 hypothetical protein [Mobiluncus mulieris]